MSRSGKRTHFGEVRSALRHFVSGALLAGLFLDPIAGLAQVGGVGPDVSQPKPCTGAAATIAWTTPTANQVFAPRTTSITVSGKITLIEGTNPTYTLLLDGTAVTTLAAGNFSHAVTVAGGAHVLTIRATSVSNPTTCTGGYSNVSTDSFSVDASATPVVTVSSGGGTTAPATVALTASVSNAYTISSVSYYYGTSLIGTSTTAPYTVNWTGSTQGNATGVGPGTYTVQAQAVDVYGELGAGTKSVTIAAAAAPTVTTTATASSPNLPATITMNATVSNPYTIGALAFHVNGASYPVTAGTTGTYQLAVPVSGGSVNTSASYAVYATASNDWGGNGTSNTVNINEAAHIAPTVTSSASGGTVAPATVALTANATAATGYTIASVQFYQNGTAVGPLLTGAPYTYSWSNVAAGSYTITATATDNLGAATTSSGSNYTVIADPGATVAVTSPSNGATGTAPASTTLTATATPYTGYTISSVQFYQNGTAVGPALTASPYTYNWTGIAQGSYSITAKSTDSQGIVTTSSPVTYTVTDPPPTVSITSPTSGVTVASSQSVNLVANATAAIGTVSSVQFYDGSTLLGSGTASGSTYSYRWPGGTVASHTITAKVTDTYNDVVTSSPITVNVVADGGPTVSMTSNTASSSSPGSFVLTASASPVSGESIASVQFKDSGTAIGVSLTSAPYTYTWTGVTAGTHSVTATATDNLGIATTSAPVALNVDALGAAITSPTNNSSAVSNQPIVITATASASDETIASVQFYDGSTLLGSGTGSGGVYTYNWSGAALGAHSLTVKVTDNTGDVQASAPIALTVVSDGGVYYIFPDQTDTPRVITRATDNQMVWRWDQADPFGMATPLNPNGAFTSNLRFPGQLYDQEDNLNYNYYRNYDPTLGRYVQSDPIGLTGGVNTYAYVGGNPLAASDPYGLWSTDVHNKMVETFFSQSGLTAQQIAWIEDGSAGVDAWYNQGPGNSYQHSMRAPNQSIEDAQALADQFIASNMGKYCDLKNARPGVQKYAYEALGAALHTVMDSTSPSHRGFQVWNPVWNFWNEISRHGDDSPEDMDGLNPAVMAETMQAMQNAMNAGPCGCH